MTLTSGRLLAQRYRLGRRIAVGGMGEVWEAQDSRLERPVAVKVLKPELSGDAEFRHRFHIEARITASLNHPGIAAVHDYGETAVGGADPDVSYLVMELVAGDPLAAILMRHPRLGTHRTLDILGQAAEALQAAHERGLVHRDVKPGNILITPTGTVKLTDFGIARAVDAAPVTRQGMVLGTAHYVAPEQAAGHDAGTASDVYSLAVVGYECLAGQRPFVADSAVTVAMMHIRDRPSPLPPDVPAGVRALIETALVKDPRQRYGTGGEFAAAVAAVRAGHRPPPPLGSAATRTDHPGVTTAMTGGMTARHLPPTALLSPAAGLDPSRRLQRRGVSRITLGLLGALAVGLAGYLIDEALRVDATSPEAGAADAVPAPDPPAVRRPAPPTPTERQPADPAEKLLGVFVNPTAYLGARGSDAAITAKSSGLVPEVVDEDGGQVDRDRRSQCRVVEVEPELRFVAPGSTLELTCRRFR